VVENEQEQRECCEELEKLTYNISHDLRAPLRAIQGFVTALVEDYEDILDETGQEFCRRIKKASQDLDGLLDDLLDYSRIGRPPMESVPTDLSAVLHVAMASMEKEILESRARIDFPSEMPDVQGNAPVLVEVTRRILSNALKFVDDGTTPVVLITCSRKAGKVRLVFEDNGLGVPAHKRGVIFELFEKAHDIRFEGNGVGLAIAKKGITRLNGSIGLEPAPKKGSRFWIELDEAKGNI